MLVPIHTRHAIQSKKSVILLTFISILVTGHGQARAALLDGFLGPVERSLAERVDKKGDA